MKKIVYFKNQFDENVLKNIIEWLKSDKFVPKVESKPGEKKWEARDLGKLILKLSPGDELIVENISELGNTVFEWLEVLSVIFSKKINLHIVESKLIFESYSSAEADKLSLLLLAIVEKDREKRRKQTKLNFKKNKKAGGRWGRNPGVSDSSLDPFKDDIESKLKEGVTQAFLAKKYGVTPGRFSYWLKKNGLR